MSEYSLSDIANNEMREFAMYTIESRAIPNMIDGLKPVQRFYLYSSIKNTPKEYKKVSAVSGVVSDYGYNHGEASAAGAGQLMAASWNNNICLIEGRGSFGTRQVQEAGAARYVYTRLHNNFHKYIKDIELSPEHDDPEHSPPRHYVPVIPLVLANGTKGIATGFATNILPRAESDLIAACKEYINDGQITDHLAISFPDFKGITYYDQDNRYICQGIFERPTSTKILITEIPYGYDRESYIKILDKLEDENKIIDYEDQCSTNGFQFEVKLKNNIAKQLNTDDKVYKFFKLEKVYNENLTVIGPDGDLCEYDDERMLIIDFVDYRMSILQKRIESKINELTEESVWLSVKKRFIQAVLDNKIIFKNKGKNDVISQIVKENITNVAGYHDRLLRLNIMSLTKELVKELEDQIKENSKKLTYWYKTTDKQQFLNDLEF